MAFPRFGLPFLSQVDFWKSLKNVKNKKSWLFTENVKVQLTNLRTSQNKKTLPVSQKFHELYLVYRFVYI